MDSLKCPASYPWPRAAAAFACLSLLLACALPSAAQQDGETLYNRKCAVCHGKDGLAQTAKGKQDHVKDVHENMKDSRTDMIKIVNDGKGDNMDGYRVAFTPAQIEAVVDYYRSLGQK